MPISVGDKLPDVNLLQMGETGPEAVSLHDKTKGRKIVIFAVPGAFTPTCHSAHVPSFIRTKDAFFEKGIEEIICIAANDAHVMKQWGIVTGATEAGLTMLADADSSFSRAIDMAFDAPVVGMYGRTKRFSAIVDDGVVTELNVEEKRGTCELSGGEALLDKL